jgi:hypothetical protein
MTLWGCRFGAGFVQCASASYTMPHIIIVAVVAGAVAAVLMYYTARLLVQLLRL